MGHPIKKLASCELPGQPPFPRRAIVERCECMHIHWRNFRLSLGDKPFRALGRAMSDAFRTVFHGLPTKGGHKVVGEGDCEPLASRKLEITLDKNMYKRFKTKDAEFYEDDLFIHVHAGELRWEMSVDEFKVVAGAFTAAADALEEKTDVV